MCQSVQTVQFSDLLTKNELDPSISARMCLVHPTRCSNHRVKRLEHLVALETLKSVGELSEHTCPLTPLRDSKDTPTPESNIALVRLSPTVMAFQFA